MFSYVIWWQNAMAWLMSSYAIWWQNVILFILMEYFIIWIVQVRLTWTIQMIKYSIKIKLRKGNSLTSSPQSLTQIGYDSSVNWLVWRYLHVRIRWFTCALGHYIHSAAHAALSILSRPPNPPPARRSCIHWPVTICIPNSRLASAASTIF